MRPRTGLCENGEHFHRLSSFHLLPRSTSCCSCLGRRTCYLGGGNCTSRASAVQDTWVLSRAVSNSRFTGGAAAKASKPIFPQLFSAKLLIPGFAQLRAAHRRHASMPVRGSRASSQAGNAAAAEQVQISRAEHSSKLLQGKLMKCRAPPGCTLCRKHIIFSNTAKACRRVTAVHRQQLHGRAQYA